MMRCFNGFDECADKIDARIGCLPRAIINAAIGKIQDAPGDLPSIHIRV